ncbi:MAG: DNA polymerase I [Ignavibacteriales bacterium]|nr:DNA polymerase I [Ignavibacteriales bacterium]
MKRKETLFLIDSMGIAYRSYFAFIQNPLINSKGENTSAIYGFVNYLNKILEEQKPDYIAAVFDTEKPTFRHKAYKEYKATRNKMPDDLAASLGYLKDVVKAYNVPVLELDGFEADDIMGTLARRAEKEKIDTYLVTSDKDFMQLVSNRVKIYRPGKFGNEDEVVGEEGVMKKFGVGPDQVIEMLGLIGDTSDNVPGVKGVGEKTALPLIQKYKTIENVLAHIDDIPQKGLQEKLRTNKDLALLSKKLVTIDVNVPIKADIHHLKAKEKDFPTLLQLFDRLEFKTLARRLKEQGVVAGLTQPKVEEVAETTEQENINTVKHQYTVIKTDKEYLRLLAELKKAKAFVFDTETTSTDTLRAQLVGIAFAFEHKKAYYLPVVDTMFDEKEDDLFGDGKSRGKQEGFDLARIVKDLKHVFENEKVKKYGQNIKYDTLVLSTKGISVAGIAFDTMIAAYTLRSDRQHSLDTLAAELLNYKMVSFEELTDGGKKDIREIPVDTVGNYSAEDADITLQLVDILHDKISSNGLKPRCTEIEFPLIEVLTQMEISGVKIDKKFLATMSDEIGETLDAIIKKIYKHAGEQFNINSTQQLAKILFEKLKLKTVRKTKTGYSTDVGVLETLRKEHPIVEEMLEYRQLQKLKSTYVDALPKQINPRTGKLHTSFNQTVAATGRLASSDPNLQNIPIRTDMGRKIRKAFIPSDKDSLILSADYSQIELRIMAHVCGDKGLLEAFNNHEDIHASTAAKVFGVNQKDVTRDMRRKAKEVNFGIMYGIGPFGLASRLDITQTEGREIIQKYFERFPKVNQYIKDTIAFAHANGFVETLKGRRRYLSDINNKNQNIRANAERQSINMPIQGTAADMIKLAMIGIHQELKKKKLESKMVLQVHDELVFDIPKNEETKMKKMVADEMKNAMKLNVPIEVEIGVGKNWLEAH